MNKLILVVDDDHDIAQIMKETLERNNYDVILAHDGIQAIEKSKSEKIDLILLDIKMPFFSGFWFCDAFKQRPETKNIPIVIVSSALEQQSIQKAYNLGAAAYLSKPFRPLELVQVVEKNLAETSRN